MANFIPIDAPEYYNKECLQQFSAATSPRCFWTAVRDGMMSAINMSMKTNWIQNVKCLHVSCRLRNTPSNFGVTIFPTVAETLARSMLLLMLDPAHPRRRFTTQFCKFRTEMFNAMLFKRFVVSGEGYGHLAALQKFWVRVWKSYQIRRSCGYRGTGV